MNPLQILPVRSRFERRQFLELPNQIHGGERQFVPPIAWDERGLLGFRRHPFHQDNLIAAFLAFRGNEPVGRIAAIHHRNHNAYHGDQCGFFGFFNCQNDEEAARELLGTAAQWLADQGLRQIRGPVSPSINYTAGILVEGFDRDPSFMIPHNPPYYGNLIESAGLKKVQDLYALWINRQDTENVMERLERVAARLAIRHGIRFRHLQPKGFVGQLENFLSVVNQSLVGHWGFVPITDSERRHLAKDMSRILLPELVVIAEIEGKPVGVALAMPDYAPSVKRINGRLFPFGFFQMLWAKRRIKRFRIAAANVLPEYKRLGIGTAMTAVICREALNQGAESIEFSWIAESNPLSFSTIETGGARRSKTLRIYEAQCADLLAQYRQGIARPRRLPETVIA